MKAEKILIRLKEKAKRENAPEIDVVDRVMGIVRGREFESNGSVAPLVWVAGFSLALAAAVTVYALLAWDSFSDPLLALIFDLPWRLL